MKKILLISLTFLILNCSTNSDNQSVSNVQITPPSWIQGTWLQTLSTDPLITQPVYRFSENDFCVISSSIETCHAQNLQQASQSGGNVNVEQIITATEYELKITVVSQTTKYNFIKINDTTIEAVNPTNGLPNLTLTRQ